MHPEYQSRPAYGCIRRGDKLAVKRTTGHKRMNLHGALCLVDFDCQIVESDRISAERTLRLLQRLCIRHPGERIIRVIMDNVRYHRARDVKAWLARDGCRVRLHFLPPHAPEMEFVQAIHGFFKVTLPTHWKSIRDTASDNFPMFRLGDFRVVK